MIKDIRASIDIGSNSVLLLVGDFTTGRLRELLKRTEITQLGKELDKNKAFHPDSMATTLNVLKSYVRDCENLGVTSDKIIVTATEAARVAQNASSFFEKIKNELNLDIKIITSEGEAYYSTRGILFDSNFQSDVITIMDIGGASTELIKVNTKNFQILEMISMPVGAVRCSQWLTDQLFVQNLQKVFADFRNDLDKFQAKEIFCVAGTITSLGNMHLQKKDFVEQDVHGLVLKIEDVDVLFKKYSDYTSDNFVESFPFLQKRSESIRGGLHLVYHICHRLLVKELKISTYGLRFGTLLEGKIREDFIYGNI